MLGVGGPAALTRLRVGRVFVPRLFWRHSYCVDALIGHGAFSSVYAATSLEHGSRVSLKILNHGHLELETGLVEVAMHARILRADPQGQRPLLRMLACFYHRERLVLVTERLYGSVLAHYMHLETTGERAQYYTGATMASMARQMLDALGFLHALGVTHCDVKPANICLIDPVARTFKLIDFGHALTAHDVHASYAQSRWYRAPEVILGVPWGESVDVFGLALALAEAATGGALFQFGASALVLAAQRAVLGPLPAWMVQANPAVAQTVLTASGTAYEIDPPGMPAGAYLVRPTSGGGAGGGPVDVSLGALLGARLDPAVFGDVEGFVGLLESLLALDPTQRPTAAQASSHAWLAAAAA